MKRLLAFIASILFIAQSYSQVQEFVDTNYDLPPGVKLPSKFEKEIDFTSKIAEARELSVVQSNHDFFSFWTPEELADIQLNQLDYYQYLLRVKSYYDQLSDRVKTVFTVADVWRVFAFNNNLKTELLLID